MDGYKQQLNGNPAHHYIHDIPFFFFFDKNLSMDWVSVLSAQHLL